MNLYVSVMSNLVSLLFRCSYWNGLLIRHTHKSRVRGLVLDKKRGNILKKVLRLSVATRDLPKSGKMLVVEVVFYLRATAYTHNNQHTEAFLNVKGCFYRDAIDETV
ncbi:hypothetical protein L1987_65227 [Smallanthus sonchifolius]|uniref:Uncharacterized protein n=1 Tax=Smallanthus sonchifolius TaxID=185202 RepID=A0ACB9BU38_9ASTR|nr:hypothetical protein L1987_65227 [Smallanthus sonchifolius]